MTKEKKNLGGRPPRYEGEDSIRIGAIVRPRYKHVLDLIARDREATIGETIELAIAKLASAYLIDNRPAIDYFRPENELYDSIKNCFIHDFSKENGISADSIEELKSNLHELDSHINTQMHLPKLVLSPFQKYCLEILTLIDLDKLAFSDWKSLIAKPFEEAWRTGVDVDSVTTMIDRVIIENKITGYLEVIDAFNRLEAEDKLIDATLPF